MGEPAVSPTYCPINGAYTFTYSVNDGTESSLECQTHTSKISDCPYGFGFNLQFQGCSFANMDMSFHCLGDWEGTLFYILKSVSNCHNCHNCLNCHKCNATIVMSQV
jgi:hypothetical protein